jgi:cobalt/nickel transport system permease protein
MHISEGIITGVPAVAYTAASLCLVGFGAKKMKDMATLHPEKKALLGMAGAFVFFLSLIPIPAFTGTCSHPCGSPLVGILLGPWIGIAITGLTLLLQAAFFAHGGFSTWGANVITLGVGGAFFGWLSFRIARKAGLSLFVAGAIGGLVGDVMTYVFAGLSLSAVLSSGPQAQYTFTGYLAAVYIAYIPTQLPIAIGEMFATGFILNYIFKQRPDVLRSLKVVAGIAAILFIPTFLVLFQSAPLFAEQAQNRHSATLQKQVSESHTEGMAGMDEAVNEKLAEKAGKSPRDPYINIEALGDVWNTVLLLGGAICGFIIGRWWHLLFEKKKNGKEPEPS